jgi:hypothetical protein
MIKPTTITSSVLSDAGPKKYSRPPITIRPTITQSIRWLACLTVIIGITPAMVAESDEGRRACCIAKRDL